MLTLRRYGGTPAIGCAGEEDLALGRLLEAGDHPQGRRLAAARRPEERVERAAGDREVHVVDRDDVPKRFVTPMISTSGASAAACAAAWSREPSGADRRPGDRRGRRVVLRGWRAHGVAYVVGGSRDSMAAAARSALRDPADRTDPSVTRQRGFRFRIVRSLLAMRSANHADARPPRAGVRSPATLEWRRCTSSSWPAAAGTRLRPLCTAGPPEAVPPARSATARRCSRTPSRRLAGRELGGRADVSCVACRGLRAARRGAAPRRRASSSEPEGRNTAAAIALAALAIDRPDDEVMVVLPADHASPRPRGLFRAVLARRRPASPAARSASSRRW